MPAVGLRVEGFDELRRALKYVDDRGLLAALKDANQLAAEHVEDAALPKAPFLTGALRRSLQARASDRSGRVVATVPYAMVIHWGRKRGNVGSPPGNRMGSNVVKGRPFIWDAAQREIPNLEPGYRDQILQVIALAIRKYGAT